MNRAVVTGPTGVVGTALVKELLDFGYELLLLVREGSPHNVRVYEMAEGRPQVQVRECSLEHLKDFQEESPRKWDLFFHLSWGGTKGKDRFDPYIHTKNVEYALDAVSLAKRLGCECFLGAGSQAEYGRCDERLTPETLPCPENAYGIGKLSAGHMTRELCRQLGIRHVWTRILSVYGPNDGEKTLITSLVNSLLKGERPVSTKGEQVWDYLYSADAARALRLIAERGRGGETYLVASGKEKLLRDYILELRDVVAPGADVGIGEMPYGDRQVMHLTADISRTTADTGFRPEISFAEGVRRMI